MRRLPVFAFVLAALFASAAITRHISFRPATVGERGDSVTVPVPGRGRSTGFGPGQADGAAAERVRAEAKRRTLVGRVESVTERGEIVVAPNGGRRTRVRLDGIAMPESEAQRKAACEALAELVRGKRVEVRYERSDSSGRVVGVVYAKSGKGEVFDVNLTLVLNGKVRVAEGFSGIPAYGKAEQSARASGLGVWANP